MKRYLACTALVLALAGHAALPDYDDAMQTGEFETGASQHPGPSLAQPLISQHHTRHAGSHPALLTF